MDQLRNRYRGCLIGQALGDALGFLIETKPRSECLEFISTFKESGKMDPDHRQTVGRYARRYQFGQYSDDTQLARELMLSLIEHRGLNLDDYAYRITALVDEQKLVAGGRTTRQAATEMIRRGISWRQAAVADSPTNGAAMRAAPIGLYRNDDLASCIDLAKKQALVTHRDSRCGDGAALVALCTAMALNYQDERVDDVQFVATLRAWLLIENPDNESDLFLALSHLQEALDTFTDEQALDVIRRLDPDWEDPQWDTISPFVTTSVLWAIYSFLRHQTSYMDCIYLALSCGGDVDTTAAIAGALSGAHVGLSGIPPHLTESLNDRGEWKRDDLIALADRLFEIKHGN